MKIVLLHLGCVAIFISACGAGAPGGNLSRGCDAEISLQPPDSVPGWVHDPRHAVRGTWITGLYARDILVISFVAGTDARARAEAVCALDGEVVGGQSAGGAEGLYYVRIPPDPTQQRMQRSVAILEALPQVNLVTPEFVDNALGVTGS